MLNKIPSFYKDNLNAKRGKQALSWLANIGLILVLTGFSFSLIFKMIGDHLPVVKNILDEVAQKEYDFKDERKDAGLLIFDEEKNLLSKETVIYKAIKSETKTALYHYNLDEKYQNFDTFKYTKIIDKSNLINNPVLFYFCDYKVKNSEFYPENPIKTDYYIDFYKNILTSKPDFEVYDLSSYTNELKYFTKDVTIKLADFYFMQDQYEDAKLTNEKVFKMLDKTYDVALNDFNDNNIESVRLLKAYKTQYGRYSNSLIIELFLSYFLATFITYLLPYFIKKDYSSVGDIILKTPIVDNNGNKINIFHELGIFFMGFLSNSYVLFILILVLYNNPGLALHSFGFLNIGVINIFSVLFTIISICLMLFTKNHQSLDAFSMLLSRKNIEATKLDTKEEEENGTSK